MIDRGPSPAEREADPIARACDATHDSTRGPGLALVGYRGSGKSTVGLLIARRAERRFLDIDIEIERAAGQSIAEIFAREGEAGFREREEATLRRLLEQHPDAVISTGGGVVLRADNRARLRRFGRVAYLSATAAALAARLLADPGDRPALTPRGLIDEIDEMLNARERLYRETADWVVETTRQRPVDVADRVLACWLGDIGMGTAGVPIRPEDAE